MKEQNIFKQIEKLRLRCKKCGHSWIPRVANPVTCPYCKFRLSKKKG